MDANASHCTFEAFLFAGTDIFTADKRK